MRFYTKQHRFFCGIDLHARLLAICIVNEAGTVVLQKQITDDKQQLREVLAPFRPDVVVAVTAKLFDTRDWAAVGVQVIVLPLRAAPVGDEVREKVTDPPAGSMAAS